MKKSALKSYDDFIDAKTKVAPACGFDPSEIIAPLFDWQKHIVRWAIRQGRAALFEDCGLGKTAQQLEWARQVAAHTGSPVLILTPPPVWYPTRAKSAPVSTSPITRS